MHSCHQAEHVVRYTYNVQAPNPMLAKNLWTSTGEERTLRDSVEHESNTKKDHYAVCTSVAAAELCSLQASPISARRPQLTERISLHSSEAPTCEQALHCLAHQTPPFKALLEHRR